MRRRRLAPPPACTSTSASAAARKVRLPRRAGYDTNALSVGESNQGIVVSYSRDMAETWPRCGRDIAESNQGIVVRQPPAGPGA